MGYYKLSENPADRSRRMQGNQELEIVQAWQKDILPEEFPEGAYGSTMYVDQPIGKATDWKAGQHVVSRFQDENPTTSDFKVPDSNELPGL
ncbi:hypothetical protein [Effusibacillus dendaii]|uniref:Uncharacterized protein n=1 Tax=Effusibacillus dendaii TaxID=2743772 RepID=A0A7I8DGL8_9BACL|nr:hypothetical protein [Effusibacillus dendaii]BCJ88492.1 hypothetical protein skT53_34770 [Effusibacillus dendaii]